MIMPDRNPFHYPHLVPTAISLAPAHPGTAAAAHPASAQLRADRVERVEKPWGLEEIVALVEGRYVGKVLTIDAGRSLSLQHHEVKDETLCVETGHISIEYGHDVDDLRVLDLQPGDRLNIRPGLLHRITAVTGSRVLETSTAAPGWREDVVRHADLYGRAGTNRP